MTRLLRQFCAGLAVTIVIALQFQDAAPTGSLVNQKCVIASLEILVLPLAFGQIWIALAWTIANAMLLAWRIRVEDGALADRR